MRSGSAVDTVMIAVSTGTKISATRSEVAWAIWPISTGPHMNPAQPQADTSATPVPGWMPGTRPAALNTTGITTASPAPSPANPISVTGRSFTASPMANNAVATAARTGSSRWALNRSSNRFPASRKVTIPSE